MGVKSAACVEKSGDYRRIEKIEERLNDALNESGKKRLEAQTGSSTVEIDLDSPTCVNRPSSGDGLSFMIKTDEGPKHLYVDSKDRHLHRQWFVAPLEYDIPANTVLLEQENLDPDAKAKLKDKIIDQTVDGSSSVLLIVGFYAYAAIQMLTPPW